MFVVGLFLGPTLVLVGEKMTVGSGKMRSQLANALIAALLAVLLVAPVAALELRLGLVLGGPLGLLLASTPLGAADEQG